MARIYSLRDAIEADIQSAGGWAAVAKSLYPTKYNNSPDAAERHLRNSVDPNHTQKLCAYQLQMIQSMAKKASGRSISLEFMCQDTGYTAPAPLSKQDRMESLYFEVADLGKRLERVVEAVKGLG